MPVNGFESSRPYFEKKFAKQNLVYEVVNKRERRARKLI